MLVYYLNLSQRWQAWPGTQAHPARRARWAWPLGPHSPFFKRRPLFLNLKWFRKSKKQICKTKPRCGKINSISSSTLYKGPFVRYVLSLYSRALTKLTCYIYGPASIATSGKRLILFGWVGEKWVVGCRTSLSRAPRRLGIVQQRNEWEGSVLSSSTRSIFPIFWLLHVV